MKYLSKLILVFLILPIIVFSIMQFASAAGGDKGGGNTGSATPTCENCQGPKFDLVVAIDGFLVDETASDKTFKQPDGSIKPFKAEWCKGGAFQEVSRQTGGFFEKGILDFIPDTKITYQCNGIFDHTKFDTENRSLLDHLKDFATGSGSLILTILNTIAGWFVSIFLVVIEFLEDAITFIKRETYVIPPFIFELWKAFAGIALSLVVLGGAVSGFLLTAHMYEEGVRGIISNLIKVVVLVALSWGLAVFALEQTKNLEEAIYTIAPNAQEISNFGQILQKNNIPRLSVTDNAAINTNGKTKISNSTTFWNNTTVLMRSVVQAVTLFFLIVPLAVIFFAFVFRMIAMYILLPLLPLAILGFFHPAFKAKIFDPWLAKFITVLKMPLILAVYLVVAIKFAELATFSGEFPATENTNVIVKLFGIFSDGSDNITAIFKNIIIYIVVIVLLVKGATEAMNNEISEKAVAWGQKAGGFLQRSTMGVAMVPYGAGKAAIKTTASVSASLAKRGVKATANILGKTRAGNAVNNFGSRVGNKVGDRFSGWRKKMELKSMKDTSNMNRYRQNMESRTSLDTHASDLKRYHNMNTAERHSDKGQALRTKLLQDGRQYGLDADTLKNNIDRGMYLDVTLPAIRDNINRRLATHGWKTRVTSALNTGYDAGADTVKAVASGNREIVDNTITGGLNAGLTSGSLSRGTLQVLKGIAADVKDQRELADLQAAAGVAKALSVGSGITGGKYRDAIGISTTMPDQLDRQIQAKVQADIEAKLKVQLEGKSFDQIINLYKGMGGGAPTDPYAREQKYQLMKKMLEVAKFSTKEQAASMKQMFNQVVTPQDQMKHFGKTVNLHELIGKLRTENSWFSDANIDAMGFHGFTGIHRLDKISLQALQGGTDQFINEVRRGLIQVSGRLSQAIRHALTDDIAIGQKDIDQNLVNAFAELLRNNPNLVT